MNTPRSLAFIIFALVAAFTVSARDASEVRPLLVGSAVPKVALSDEAGVTQYLPSILKDRRSVVVFYRGGWCPYCSTHLQELAQIEPELLKLGYQIIAISPDSPENLSSIEKDGELAYQLFSDSSLEVAEAFGIDFTMDKAALAKYKEYGIDLEKSSGGANKNRLPVPAVFIVTPESEIAFTYVNPDIRSRIPGKLLLASAKAISEL